MIAVIDDSFAKLRLFKITEFVAAAFMLAVLGGASPCIWEVADGPARGPGRRARRPATRA